MDLATAVPPPGWAQLQAATHWSLPPHATNTDRQALEWLFYREPWRAVEPPPSNFSAWNKDQWARRIAQSHWSLPRAPASLMNVDPTRAARTTLERLYRLRANTNPGVRMAPPQPQLTERQRLWAQEHAIDHWSLPRVEGPLYDYGKRAAATKELRKKFYAQPWLAEEPPRGVEDWKKDNWARNMAFQHWSNHNNQPTAKRPLRSNLQAGYRAIANGLEVRGSGKGTKLQRAEADASVRNVLAALQSFR